MMPSTLPVRAQLLSLLVLSVLPFSVLGQMTATPESNEYPLSGPLPGDQVHPAVALNQQGGILVWEENGTAKTGWQIRASRLNTSLTRTTNFLVNAIATGDQRNPQAQFLSNSNVIFVWQGNGTGNADVYARIMKTNGAFLTSDLRLNTYLKEKQSDPVVCALSNGALVAWESAGQDGSLLGIFARIISATGAMPKKEFLVNQATSFNQRSPAVARLDNGNAVIVWISEQERFEDSVDVYARLFDAAGTALSDEFLINSANNICANPSIAPLSSGGFTIVWSEKDSQSRSNSWEVMGRSFSADGRAVDAEFKINTNTYGDQFRPKISAVGTDAAVVWTSLGQDGSRDGVFGRLLLNGAQPAGEEFQGNTTTISQQIHPVVAAIVANRILVVWSSFVARTGFDLFGRQFNLNQQQ